MNPQFERIKVGCQVEIVLVDRGGNNEQLKFVIVADEDADFSNGYLGENTPLAKAILGEKPGTTIPYLRDDIASIHILSVATAIANPSMSSKEKRKAKMQKTIREVEDTNAMVFASSFSGKWGDYDPESIPKGKDAEEKD